MHDYKNYENKTWSVKSDCESVRMMSTLFKTEVGDIVTIGKTEYSGTTKIDTISSNNFTVAFLSDSYGTSKGFDLHWSCTQWGEWQPIRDETCRNVRRPLNNGTMTTGLLMYERNETCSKFVFTVHRACRYKVPTDFHKYRS